MLSFLFETVLKNSLDFNLINPSLAEKSILITLLPFEKHWKIIFSHDDVYCYEFSDEDKKSKKHTDLHISATPRALLAMLLRGDRTGLKLEGDVVLAQTLEHCFHEFVSNNGESFIRKFFQDKLGDFSYPIIALFRKGYEKIQDLNADIKTTLTDYLQEDTDCLPLLSEVRDFCDAVDELRLKMDRLEASFYSESYSDNEKK